MEKKEILNTPNFIKQEIPSEPDENDNNIETVLELEVKYKTEVVSEEHTELDWCLQNAAVLGQSLDQPDEVIDFDDLHAVSFQKCLMCHAIFMDRYSLIQHNLGHLIVRLSEPRLYQCHHCLTCFTEKDKLIVHIKLKHFRVLGYKSAKPHECQLCSKVFSYKYWHAHMAQVHGTGRFKCDYCCLNFKCKRYLKRHLLKHKEVQQKNKENRSFQCHLCPKQFKNQACLTCHKKNCHSKPVECTICGSKLKSQSYLNAHLRRVHYSDGKEHRCDICSKKFRSKRYVDIHYKNMHVKTQVNRFLRCQYCDKKLWSENRLKDHMKICPVIVKSNINVD